MFLTIGPQLTLLFIDCTLLKAWLQVAEGTYVWVAFTGGGQLPNVGEKWNSSRAPVTPRMMKTMRVSIPRKPNGLINLDGNTIFSPRRRVRSSLTQVHLMRAMTASRTPFFLLLGAANSRIPVQAAAEVSTRASSRVPCGCDYASPC